MTTSDYRARIERYNAEVEAEREAIRLATPDGYRLAFGMPYAHQNEDNTVTCPRCGARIKQGKRKDFESFTGEEYVEHYHAEHAATDGRIFVAGRWWERLE